MKKYLLFLLLATLSGPAAACSFFINCGSNSSGGGGVPGGSNTQVQFNNAAAFAGSSSLTWVSPTLTVGLAGTTTGKLNLTGVTSGTITIQGQSVAGTYNFNLPITAGTAGQALTSGGGAAAASTWSNLTAITTTNDNAAAGNLGEYITATIATGASVTLTTAVTANVTSVSLTGGDWDCDGTVDYTFGATTSYTNLTQGISTTSITLGAQDTFTDFATAALIPTAAKDMALAVPTVRESLASTTTVFLVAQATFTVSTLKAYGTIRCRRMR